MGNPFVQLFGSDKDKAIDTIHDTSHDIADHFKYADFSLEDAIGDGHANRMKADVQSIIDRNNDAMRKLHIPQQPNAETQARIAADDAQHPMLKDESGNDLTALDVDIRRAKINMADAARYADDPNASAKLAEALQAANMHLRQAQAEIDATWQKDAAYYALPDSVKQQMDRERQAKAAASAPPASPPVAPRSPEQITVHEKDGSTHTLIVHSEQLPDAVPKEAALYVKDAKGELVPVRTDHPPTIDQVVYTPDPNKDGALSPFYAANNQTFGVIKDDKGVGTLVAGNATQKIGADNGSVRDGTVSERDDYTALGNGAGKIFTQFYNSRAVQQALKNDGLQTTVTVPGQSQPLIVVTTGLPEGVLFTMPQNGNCAVPLSEGMEPNRAVFCVNPDGSTTLFKDLDRTLDVGLKGGLFVAAHAGAGVEFVVGKVDGQSFVNFKSNHHNVINQHASQTHGHPVANPHQDHLPQVKTDAASKATPPVYHTHVAAAIKNMPKIGSAEEYHSSTPAAPITTKAPAKQEAPKKEPPASSSHPSGVAHAPAGGNHAGAHHR